MINYLAEADAIFPSMVANRRKIHEYPELEFNLPKTTTLIKESLTRLNIPFKENIGKSGIIADLITSPEKQMIAFRADMDALPIQESNQVEYKSKIDGVAHLCGHDAHTSILLGFAEILSKHRNLLSNNIRLIFQPNEEKYPGGAKYMIEDGALTNVSKIFAYHVWPTLESGKFGLCGGPAFAQPDIFDVEITGKGGHAAMPHESIDPIAATIQLINSLQYLISREINSFSTSVLSITKINAGNKHNVIPSAASFGGTLRTLSASEKKFLKNRIFEIVEHNSTSLRVNCTIQYRDGYPILINNTLVTSIVNDLAVGLVGAENVENPSPPTMAGEDFAYYLEKIPGCLIFLGCQNKEKGINQMLHHPKFNIDEPCMRLGAALFSKIAFEYGTE